MRCCRLLFALPPLVGALLVAAPAAATLLELRTVGELAWTSDAVVRGRVTEARASWSASGAVIVTTFTVEPADVLGGTMPEGPVRVTRVGGELDGLALGYAGMPDLDVGDEAVLFLRRRGPDTHVIVGLCQGVLVARDGAFVRDLSAVSGAPAREEAWSPESLAAEVRRARQGRP